MTFYKLQIIWPQNQNLNVVEKNPIFKYRNIINNSFITFNPSVHSNPSNVFDVYRERDEDGMMMEYFQNLGSVQLIPNSLILFQ